MLCGYLPFDEESKSVLYQKILSCRYSIPRHVSSEARDLIKKLLVRDTKERLTIAQIKKHPWFNRYKPIRTHKGIIASETIFPVGKPPLITP